MRNDTTYVMAANHRDYYNFLQKDGIEGHSYRYICNEVSIRGCRLGQVIRLENWDRNPAYNYNFLQMLKYAHKATFDDSYCSAKYDSIMGLFAKPL